MLFLLHGSDVSSSRQALLEIKKNYSPESVTTFAAEKFDSDELKRVSETPSMFSDRRLVVIEGKLPTTGYPLPTIPPATDLIFWIGEELKSSNKLVKLVRDSGGQVRLFRERIPRHVFGFLDALAYKNKKKAFLELHRLLDQGEAPLYLLTMIVWQFRNLLSVKVSTSQSVKGMNPYVLRKAQSQVKNFEGEELISIFKDLLNAEVKLKTSNFDPVFILDRLVNTLAARPERSPTNRV